MIAPRSKTVVHHGDCLDVLLTLPEASVDAVVTDPPYHLTSIVKRFGKEGSAPAKSNGATGVYARASAGFMGKQWDGGDIAMRPELWAEVLRVLKPGGFIAAFGGTRTYHRMACAIEDAGFEIRDSLSWLYGTGFPKSLCVSKALDRATGAEGSFGAHKSPRHAQPRHYQDGMERPCHSDEGATDRNGRLYIPATDAAKQWAGFGTALKPSHEPIVLARKPLAEPTVAAQVLATGTGALNIDGSRVGYASAGDQAAAIPQGRATAKVGALAGGVQNDRQRSDFVPDNSKGRFPPNLLHDGSAEVLEAFGRFDPKRSAGDYPSDSSTANAIYGPRRGRQGQLYADTGTTARFFPALGYGEDELRFFYSGKASRAERGEGNGHPTVKPIALMAWLCRLITPPGGRVLDPFAGSGSTGLAAQREGFDCVLIEREAEYVEIINARLAAERASDLIDDLFSRSAVA